MVFEYIKTGWQAYKSNFMSFIIAELIALIIVISIIGVGTGIIFTTMGISSFAELRSPELSITRIVSVFPLFMGLSISLIFYLIAALVAALFITGLFYMAAESLRGSTDFKSMFTAIKEVGLTGILTSIVVWLIALILMFILVAALGVIFPVIGSVVGAVLFLLIMVLFSLVYPGIVIDDIGPIEAIERSVNVTKKNYSDVFALLVFYVGIYFGLIFIPFIGQILILFVIMPICFISLTFFYKRNRI
jgi:hypothetical protein